MSQPAAAVEVCGNGDGVGVEIVFSVVCLRWVVFARFRCGVVLEHGVIWCGGLVAWVDLVRLVQSLTFSERNNQNHRQTNVKPYQPMQQHGRHRSSILHSLLVERTQPPNPKTQPTNHKSLWPKPQTTTTQPTPSLSNDNENKPPTNRSPTNHANANKQ